ncbi:predicted protein [Scheffersomyces stipitis CBS 6054]|uniref:TLC domain-containing protein n=1 Tax=Scheffersomyces stipitis (strain ATCC 58785 / CBS 6054 / NBRC 10063 / NRRL Y-11545) TaxID=322104 RepID=A3LRF4_PICST|nr:predicted protein [Scheffersomyces stipitis CBS 6054]ABN65728.2 predicted protein [Scheffersomyces stipitis CBS 6054]KAG2733708.1 hypothetical protein G9P44_003233 [Scheffersomyces stipitis]
MSFITSHFPVFTEDPFLSLRPFPEHPTNFLEEHWHEVLASFLFYFTAQLLSAPFSTAYFGKTYTQLPHKTKVNFDIHVVSMVQCVISIGILIPMWNHSHWQNRVEDPFSSILGASNYGGFVAALTIGYFLWDLYVCVRWYSLFGLGFLFHGFAAFYVFSCSLIPYCQPWIPAFLLFELSTPFVNINWFASRLPAGTFNDTFVIVNGLGLLITFFSVRIAWGFYAAFMVATDMFAVFGKTHWFLPVTILGLNLMLDSLNVFWFYKMVMIAKKKIFGKSHHKKLE